MKDGKIRYEIVVVLAPKAEAKQSTLDKLSAMIEGQGVTVTGSKSEGIKDLVYEIKKQRKGDFWVVDAEGSKALQLKEINLFLNRDVNVIRYLIIRK